MTGCAPPAAITQAHRLDGFACGKPPLDAWLKTRAMDNEGRASRTYVVAATGGPQAGHVIAYYTLASGTVPLKDVPRKYRHNLPNPVGIMLLGRLAVDHRHGGHGIGSALLRRALEQTLHVADIVGVRALLVHAIDDDAVRFYARYGFQNFPPAARTMFMAIETIADSIQPWR